MNRQIIEEASEWFVQLSEGDADVVTRKRFHDWLSRSPENIQAYLKILPVWEDATQLDTHANDREALIAWARAGNNVIPLGLSASDALETANAPRPPLSLSLYKFAFAATVAIVASAAFAWFAVNQATYVTGIGERRSVVLDDGSSVEMNSRSRAKIRFNAQQRSVELLEGQALFKVAKDVARPFFVKSADTSVRVMGTQFDVYRKRAGTVVTVVEGKVAVVPPAVPESPPHSPGNAAAVVLIAGQQLTIAPDVSLKPKQVNVAVATAWTQQQLVFFRTPLREVAEEFNRYNKQQLVIKDDRVKTFHISGTFSSTNPALLIRFLQDQPELKVAQGSHEVSVDIR